MKAYNVAICGSVGSGKSSLLCNILGEIPRFSGWGIQVYGSKAYVLQSAWIQTGTVRDNVLFDSKMDEELYESVLRACALNKDVSNWVNGDLILVGERGTKLSGGQKPRIQPSRAIYSDSDVYFLDDPFNAVDALTGAHLFQARMSDLTFVKQDCCLCHPSVGISTRCRPCSGIVFSKFSSGTNNIITREQCSYECILFHR
ncbi:hypothetical protein ACSBR2_006743 [Camellia fascicularis]